MKGRRFRIVLAFALVLVAALMLRRSLRLLAESNLPDGIADVPVVAGEPAAPGAGAPRQVPPPLRVLWEEVVSGLEKPLFVTHAGDGSGRIFVVEQVGRVRVVRDGRLLERPFLDVSGALDTSRGERGLLGLAFAPDYRRSGVFYLTHTAADEVRVVRGRVSADADVARAGELETVLAMSDPAGNHNGGMIAFGPDGNLWVGTGDGGGGGDPWNNAQDLGSLLGKVLRLEVGSAPYAIPPGNPFAGRPLARPEIWAYGLRNPWRFSFDRATGELWIGDVGQNAWEEVDFEDPRRGGGRNYGWRVMEGRHCFRPRQGCDAEGLVAPVFEYGHGEGCSVTGGYVYRGRNLPALAGWYVFADYCRGTVWALSRRGGEVEVAELAASGARVSSFGEDEAGELYLCDHARGRVLRLAAAG